MFLLQTERQTLKILFPVLIAECWDGLFVLSQQNLAFIWEFFPRGNCLHILLKWDKLIKIFFSSTKFFFYIFVRGLKNITKNVCKMGKEELQYSNLILKNANWIMIKMILSTKKCLKWLALIRIIIGRHKYDNNMRKPLVNISYPGPAITPLLYFQISMI